MERYVGPCSVWSGAGAAEWKAEGCRGMQRGGGTKGIRTQSEGETEGSVASMLPSMYCPPLDPHTPERMYGVGALQTRC